MSWIGVSAKIFDAHGFGVRTNANSSHNLFSTPIFVPNTPVSIGSTQPVPIGRPARISARVSLRLMPRRLLRRMRKVHRRRPCEIFRHSAPEAPWHRAGRRIRRSDLGDSPPRTPRLKARRQWLPRRQRHRRSEVQAPRPLAPPPALRLLDLRQGFPEPAEESDKEANLPVSSRRRRSR